MSSHIDTAYTWGANSNIEDSTRQESGYRDTSNHETSHRDTSNHETSYRDTSNHETSYRDTSNHETPYRDTSYRDTSRRESGSRKDDGYKNDDSYRDSSYNRHSSYRVEEEPSKPKTYPLKTLKEFLSSRGYYITRQFTYEGSLVYIKVYCESIGEHIFVYIPSKYNIDKEDGQIPITELIPHDLTDQDLLSLYKDGESRSDEQYNELQLDDLKDGDSFAEHHYKPLDIDNSKNMDTRRQMVQHVAQLNKFKLFTSKIKYKFSILTDNTFCVINRHNEIDTYFVKYGKGIVPDVVDTTKDTIEKIGHELYVTIDLSSFHEKLSRLPMDVIKLYKNFYSSLTTVHGKQTGMINTRFKNYQQVISKLVLMYKQKAKFLQLMDTLTSSLQKTIEREKVIVDAIAIIKSGPPGATSMANDKERSVKLTKHQQDLTKLREVKQKTIKMLTELKRKLHSFLITFDYVVSETYKDLTNIESRLQHMGIVFERPKK